MGIALSLTGIGGFVDAVGYVALFQIFTANMSGNSVHVGIDLGRFDFSDLMRPVCAIAAYVSGIVLTRIAVEVATRSGVRSIASFTLAGEVLLLVLFAQARPAMHLGQIADIHAPTYFALVALLAFAMGIQTATLTHIGPLTVYTTFVTGTLTKFADALAHVLCWSYDQLRRFGRLSDIVRLIPKQQDARNAAFLASIWFCYLAGATVGILAKRRWELRALHLPVAALVVFIVVDRFRPIVSEN
jgi:uncharacterized membrane protein YoaK (UPF0700 family)